MTESTPKRNRRLLKKYPNRRLYDTQLSAYVTIEDVRQYILGREAIQVLDSKTGQDITRVVLLQIISEQESEGHEPLLTNRVLEVLIRFYGEPGYGYLGRFLEQSISTFLEQQRRYQRHMQDLLDRSPIRLVQQFADQNASFWRNLLGGATASQTGIVSAAQQGSEVSEAGTGSPPGTSGDAHTGDDHAGDDDAPLDEGIELHGAPPGPGTAARTRLAGSEASDTGQGDAKKDREDG